MKRSIWWSRFCRKSLRLRLQIGRWFTPHDGRRVNRPTRITPEVDTALRIWSRVVHEDTSTLLYNPQTHESYAEWTAGGGPIYLFLESGRLRIVNTVVGYDVRLDAAAENWCSQVFTREVHRRRSAFKRHALGKVVHSLDELESRIGISSVK